MQEMMQARGGRQGQFTSKKLDRITVFHDLQRFVAIMKAGNPVQNDL
jgi:hypothetical protein